MFHSKEGAAARGSMRATKERGRAGPQDTRRPGAARGATDPNVRTCTGRPRPGLPGRADVRRPEGPAALPPAPPRRHLVRSTVTYRFCVGTVPAVVTRMEARCPAFTPARR